MGRQVSREGSKKERKKTNSTASRDEDEKPEQMAQTRPI